MPKITIIFTVVSEEVKIENSKVWLTGVNAGFLRPSFQSLCYGFIESIGWRTACNMWDAQTAEREVERS